VHETGRNSRACCRSASDRPARCARVPRSGLRTWMGSGTPCLALPHGNAYVLVSPGLMMAATPNSRAVASNGERNHSRCMRNVREDVHDELRRSSVRSLAPAALACGLTYTLAGHAPDLSRQGPFFLVCPPPRAARVTSSRASSRPRRRNCSASRSDGRTGRRVAEDGSTACMRAPRDGYTLAMLSPARDDQPARRSQRRYDPLRISRCCRRRWATLGP